MHQPLILTIGVKHESKNVSEDAQTYTEGLPPSAPRRLNGLAVRNPTKMTEAPEVTDRV